MAILWDIIDDVRCRLVETPNLRTVVIGDDDVPASLLPAARVQLVSAASDYSTGIPIIIDVTLNIEIINSLSKDERSISQLVQDVIEALIVGEYPHGARIVCAPNIKNINRNANTAKITMTIRWVERSE